MYSMRKGILAYKTNFVAENKSLSPLSFPRRYPTEIIVFQKWISNFIPDRTRAVC